MKTPCAALAALCLDPFRLAPALAQAQYPDRPIRIVVGFTPGGGNDIIARLPDVVSRLKLLNIDSVGNSSQAFSRIIAADLDRWKAVARAGNIKMAQ